MEFSSYGCFSSPVRSSIRGCRILPRRGSSCRAVAQRPKNKPILSRVREDTHDPILGWTRRSPGKGWFAGANQGPVQLSPSQKLAVDVFRDGFMVPKNVCLNRSIDGAFRRWQQRMSVSPSIKLSLRTARAMSENGWDVGSRPGYSANVVVAVDSAQARPRTRCTSSPTATSPPSITKQLSANFPSNLS